MNFYDDYCIEDIYVEEGDYVIANIDDFGLEKGKKYKVLNVYDYDLITVEIYDGYADMFSVDYFDKYKNEEE